MIDWNRVAELREEVGLENFDEVVDLFLFEVEDELSRLRDSPNISTLAARFHFLKGSAMNLGFAASSELCQSGETAAGKGHEGRIDIEAVVACYDISKHEFTCGLHRFAAA